MSEASSGWSDAPYIISKRKHTASLFEGRLNQSFPPPHRSYQLRIGAEAENGLYVGARENHRTDRAIGLDGYPSSSNPSAFLRRSSTYVDFLAKPFLFLISSTTSWLAHARGECPSRSMQVCEASVNPSICQRRNRLNGQRCMA